MVFLFEENISTEDFEILDILGAVSIEFPLRGTWTAIRTPFERIPSHGSDCFGQRYAMDFVRVNPVSGRSNSGCNFKRLIGVQTPNDFYSWNENVFSPVHGKVVRIENNVTDKRRLNLIGDYFRSSMINIKRIADEKSYEIIAGNYIIIEADIGFVLLAHLKWNSIGVNVGDRVFAGDYLGSVGCTGNCLIPHLHLQVMDSPELGTANGVLFKFKNIDVYCDNNWQSKRQMIPDVDFVLRYEK